MSVGKTASVTIDPRRHDAVLFRLDAVDSQLALVALVHQLHQAGVRTAVFSSDRNRAAVPGLFGVGDDGPPDPATAIEAAGRLAALPGRCVVVDNAEAGVAAARSAGFALVIGMDRSGRGGGAKLHQAGADVVAADLSEVTVRTGDRPMSALPDAMTALVIPDRPAVFFDFDGTLSEIVNDPDAARLVAGAAEALQALATCCPVAVVSGRGLTDVQQRIGLSDIWYAGSHGFELAGPDGSRHQNDATAAAVPVLAEAAASLRAQLDPVPGVLVEHKRFAVAVHYRNAAREEIGTVIAAVRTAGQRYRLRVTTGREVIELRPDVDWDKGKTLRWVIDQLAAHEGAGRRSPIYLGDDITDEDAFDAVHDPDVSGIGIVVRHTEDGDRATAARFALDSPGQVVEFINQLTDRL
ncbi:MAG TPA: trehalose-phosphatase [Mycobacterium sp.]|nr:trehalose-phosphatase [Mycobacterium sp.]